eukprot:Em0008g807a
MQLIRLPDNPQGLNLASVQGVGRHSLDSAKICSNSFSKHAGSIDVLWTLRSLLASLVCRLRPCEAFKQTGRMQVTTLRSLQANRSYAGYDPAKPSSKPVVSRLRPCEAFKQTWLYAGSFEDGTCENYFQQPFTLWYAGSIDVLWTLRSLLASLLYAGYDPAKPSSNLVVCRLRPCEAFKQTGPFQHGFKIIPVIQGLISSQDKSESFARNLASVQGVGRHSLDSAKICSKSFPKYAGSIDVLWTLRSLLASLLYAGYDPAKPSSKLVVCRLRPCEAFKQIGRMQVPLKMEPAKTTSCNHLCNGMQVTTLRSLQANWSYAGYDPAKPSSKPVVSRLRPCEAFKQTWLYAGSFEDGTCENYFQQPFTLWYAGYDPAKPSSKPVVSRLRPCEAFKQTWLYAGSFEDGTCENYFQQPFTLWYAGYDPAKPSSKLVVCRLRPCEAFKQIGRMQVPLKMEPAKTTSCNHLCNGMQVTTLRSLQANWSYAGYDPAKPSSKPVVSRLRPCEPFKQTWLYAGYDPAKPSNKPVVSRLRPCEALKQTWLYAGSFEDGTCENYFQQPFTLWYAGYDPAKPSSKLVVCRLRPCEVFKQTGRMQVTTLRSLQANRVVCRLRPCEAFKQIDHELSFNKLCLTLVFFHLHAGMQVTTLRSLQTNRSYAGSIEDGTYENYFQQPFMQWYAGYDPAKPSNKPVVSRLRPCEALKQTWLYAGSFEDGTCENYFQQPFTLWYAGYGPAKSSSKLVVCSLRPCEAFKQTGRMQVTTLRSLQANRSYAGSIEDGTCENYFQQPFTLCSVTFMKMELFPATIYAIELFYLQADMQLPLTKANQEEESTTVDEKSMATGCLGGMENVTGECFLVEVDRRDAATLLQQLYDQEAWETKIPVTKTSRTKGLQVALFGLCPAVWQSIMHLLDISSFHKGEVKQRYIHSIYVDTLYQQAIADAAEE